MTSGEFRSIAVDSITIDPTKRLRREIKPAYIRWLADDISQVDLIHPPVVTRDLELVSGECRWLAVKSLGWTHIKCQYLDEVDDPALLEEIKLLVKLSENIKRSNLIWQEEVCAVADYDHLRRNSEPKWTQEDTAAATGMKDQSNVSVYIALAREIRAGNRNVIDAPNLSTARGWMDRQTKRKKAQGVRDSEKFLRELELLEEEPPPSVINTDFIKWAKTYTGDKFNFIHCDFPYGIDTDKRQQGNAVAIHGGYPDSFETYRQLLEALCKNLDRFCDESAHIMFWFSMHYYQWTLDYITNNTDFVLDPFPLVWHKSDNKGLLPDPQRGPRRVYETCLFGSRGDRLIVGAKANACSKQTEDDPRHLSPKPQPVLRHFFEMIVDDNTTILDPTCGSGNALCVAKEFGAARVLGLEIDPEFAKDAELLVAGTRRVIRSPASVAL